MGMQFEFNWYLVSSDELSPLRKGDENAITKDGVRIYPIGMPIPYIEKETGCKGLVEINEVVIIKDKTKITFVCTEPFDKDNMIGKHYYDMYKKMKGESVDKVSGVKPTESELIKSMIKMKVNEIAYKNGIEYHMYSDIQLDNIRFSEALLVDVYEDEINVFCKSDEYSMMPEPSSIVITDNNFKVLDITIKNNIMINEYHFLIIHYAKMFDAKKVNVFTNNDELYNSLHTTHIINRLELVQ
jgi:hypothetical protein